MTTTRKALVVAFATGALVTGGAGPAFAHNVYVTTPGGPTNCQFLGGPGNPGHEGHAHGHTTALAHEQSDAVDIAGGTCP